MSRWQADIPVDLNRWSLPVEVGDSRYARMSATCDGTAWGANLVIGVEGQVAPDMDWVEWDTSLRLSAEGVTKPFDVRGFYAIRGRVLTPHATAGTVGRIGLALGK